MTVMAAPDGIYTDVMAKAVRRMVERFQPVWRMLLAVAEAKRREALMPPGLAQAVTEWDRALDDAEATYQDALDDWRWDWLRVGAPAQGWRMWAALTPGLTYDAVLATAGGVLASRFRCDWTDAEAARVATAVLEGWQDRQRFALTGPR